MSYREICYKSSDRESDIYAYIWEPEPGILPIGVLQIAHGMCEHAMRYDAFARFMCGKGFVVCANDHLGHGKSANGHFGHFGKSGGHRTLAKDVYKLFNIVKKEHAAVPYIIMGHSLGSFIARYACSLWGIEFDGAIFSGTGNGIMLSRAATLILGTAANVRGSETPAKLVVRLMHSAFNRRFRVKGIKPNGLEWLSRDEQQVHAFIDDPLCNFPLTIAGFRDTVQLMRLVSGKQWANRMPKDLPIYLFSGLEDPVGDLGRGVISTYQALVYAGCDNVEIKLYEDARHEMLFELNKDEAYEDIYKWISDTVLTEDKALENS